MGRILLLMMGLHYKIMNNNNYNDGLRKDKKETREYYQKSIIKTEQQKFLESLIKKKHDDSVGFPKIRPFKIRVDKPA